MSAEDSSNDALMQFLYQAPIGLVQTRIDGEITMINPMAAMLLMPLVPDGSLLNIFQVLAVVAPDLREQAASHDRPGEMICDMLRITLPVMSPANAAQTLGLRLLKLDAATLMATVSDLTLTVAQEQQRLASRLRDVSRTDALTQMPNRAALLERVTEALARTRVDPDWHFAVMFVNTDRFNGVNVAFGQKVGDGLLCLMAGRLAQMLRPGDALGRAGPFELTAARVGGDEFVVVIEGLRDGKAIDAVAQRLVDGLGKPYRINDQPLHVSVSLGVVLDPAPDAPAESVLQDASIAMREAKRGGGACWQLFEPAMKERAERRGSMERELRHALGAGQLFVAYQPIVELSGGQCTGVEALVRWRHPVRGLVSPIEFIGIAEETGLIGALGLFVLNASCRQFALWQRTLGAAAPRRVSVNVSRAQLADPLFVEQVGSALRASGMAGADLQLEVTESLAAQDETVQRRLGELKGLGLTIALDDFGTGYSSLSSLHQLPVDVVKIDRSFVCLIESSAHHRVLVQATILVARSLGLATVAEGIETAGQAAALAALQCDKGQGYLFARPLPADEATAWLAARVSMGEPA